MQRNQDFSAGQHKTKIPVSNKARVGRSSGNRGPNAETRPKQGRGPDTENRVRPKAGGKIHASFNLLKRGQKHEQLIHGVRHILANVNGLNDPNKRNTIFTHFKNSGDDIFFLQDLRADSENKLNKWLQKWEGPSYSAGKDKSSSIAILFMKNTQFEVNKFHKMRMADFCW